MSSPPADSVMTPRATFEEAIGLVNAGDAVAAERVCREALERQPDEVNLTALLGAILLKLRRAEEAEALLRRAIELAPTFAKPHEDLGQLLVERGRAEEAAAVLQEAVRLDPELDRAWFQLGKALLLLGNGREADEAFDRSFALNPVKRQLAEAARQHKAGNLEQAERIYRRVLRRHPRNVTALRLLGVIAMQSGHAQHAEGLLKRAIKFAPDFFGAVLDLGRLHQDQHQLAPAIDCFRRATEIRPESAQAHFLLAAALAPAARTEEAAAAYRRTIELRPDHAGAWLGLGHVLKTLGHQAEAVDAYRHCLRVSPGSGECYWSLANLKTYRLSEQDMRDMEAALAEPELNEQSEVNLLFALAKAHEDRGDYQRAWHYYETGNGKQRLRESYDAAQTELTNEAIRAVFTRELLEVNEGGGEPDPAPIFIVGLPRSGSTLIEQILASHSQVEGTAELPYLGRVAASLNRNRADGVNYPEAVRELGPDHFRELGRRYLELASLHRVEGRPRFIDKMPNNFPNIGFIHLILPQAKIIDARRHPMDACLSCYRQLFARGQNFTYELSEIGDYFLDYQRMMDHWHEVLPGRVLTMQYEELVSDFEDQLRRLLDYCELPWEDACLDFHETERPVRTASSEQVRQPIYRGAVGQFRRYEAYIGELREVLAPARSRYDHLLP